MEIGYWKLDGDAVDSSRFGNNSETVSAFFDSPPILPGGIYSARFAGAQSISIPHSETLDPLLNDFYLDFFIERENDNFTILDKGCYSAGHNTELTFTAQSESGATYTWNSGVAISADEEHHVVISYRQAVGEVAFFIDGIREALVYGTPIRTLASTSPLTIGTGFIGRLDDLRIAIGVPRQRRVTARHQELSTKVDYERLVNYKVPYSFTPMGQELGDSTYQGRDLVWSVEPAASEAIIFGLPSSSYVNTETATLAVSGVPLSVTAWIRYQPGFQLLNYGTVTLDADLGRIRAGGLQSGTLVAGQLCFVGLVLESGSTKLYVNGSEWTEAVGPGAGASISFFGGAASHVAGLEVVEAVMPTSELDKRYQLGFTGVSHLSPPADSGTTSIAEESKVLDFEWTNYSVKR